MDERKVFTIQKLKLKLATGQEIELDALLSEHGAKRVFHESNLPSSIAPFLTKEVEILYKGHAARASFIKETTFDGVFFNMKFVNVAPAMRDIIREDVKSTGVNSPWQRKFPRIAISENAELPMPFMAVLDHGGVSVFLQIRNFTLGGLLLDYTGDELGTLHIGSKLLFDILANNGEKISDVQGMVMHVSQELKETKQELQSFQFGVKITGMSMVNDTKYRNLIRECLMGMQKK